MSEELLIQEWNWNNVGITYLVGVAGALCTIQLMEQWRLTQDEKVKNHLLKLSSFALGGCTIWALHFTGMDALVLKTKEGRVLDMQYEGFLTIFSIIAPVTAMYIGLRIASRDGFFLAVQSEDRKLMLREELKHVKLSDLQNKRRAKRIIMTQALLRNVYLIGFGGAIAGTGGFLMHFLGMYAQQSTIKMSLHLGYVFLTIVLAVIIASTAFWIIFRLLTFWPEYESLRYVSAMVMAFAGCTIHFVGLLAGTYTLNDRVIDAWILLDGPLSAKYASHGAIFISYILCTYSVVRNLRNRAFHNASTGLASTAGSCSATASL